LSGPDDREAARAKVPAIGAEDRVAALQDQASLSGGVVGLVRPLGVEPAPPRFLRRYPLLAYIARRIGAGLIVALVVSVVVFVGTQVLPGDAANAILGRNATPASLHLLREQLGLNKPVTGQYFTWLGHLLSGNLGTSLAAGEPVGHVISSRIGNSLALAGVTLLLLIPISLGLGTLAGIRRGGRLDRVISGLTLGAIALPEFVTGTLLVLIFAVKLKALPAVSLVQPGSNALGQPKLLVLPVVTLLIASLAYTIRMVRAGVAEVMESEYVQAARLNGLPEGRVIRRHVLRNALAPSVQTFALTIQFLIGGVIVVETVFQYPGLGLALAQSVAARDIPTVQAVATLLAVLYIAINIAADVVVVLLVPKLRTAQ
jgi:peptide/nickel transport system permease protein